MLSWGHGTTTANRIGGWFIPRDVPRQRRRAIVRDDADRQRRLDWLQRTAETYGWRLHAFALLTNHEHLFLETPEPNLSAGMHLLNGSYTGYFNVRHRRVGHLFQGRFKANLIEEEGYFMPMPLPSARE